MANSPRLFISYSWSTPQHEQWVIDLATELVGSGVDVILDKWALREGHDAVAFMEQMVSDPSISKVIIICDQAYVNKADGRSGGVGTETQIISAEVYAKAAQDKFVAVISEKSPEGEPCLPIYYKSRIYVDLSESDRYAENFEKLLRWVFDKPLYVKPELGKAPSFITDGDTVTLGTSTLSKRVIDGFKNDKGFARGALDEYLALFAENLERFRITQGDGEIDDQVTKSIDDFLPYRNEFVAILNVIVRYAEMQACAPVFHRFFESLHPYFSRPAGVSQWSEMEFDNFRFIVHELFLYTLAIFLRAEHLEAAGHLLAEPYLACGNSDGENARAVSFVELRQHMKSLDHRNRKLGLNRLSLRADLLEQRSKNSGVQFRHIMQADFVCFFRSDILSADGYNRWWPETLLYAGRLYGPFELFARSVSKSYLSRVLPLLGVSSVNEIRARLDSYSAGERSVPRWKFESFDPGIIFDIEKLGSKA